LILGGGGKSLSEHTNYLKDYNRKYW
jgi:hypothetical protein